MIYGSWNIRCNRQNFLSLWAIFCPFSPLDNLENQNFNNEKNTWIYYHFTHLHHKWLSYDVWFLRYGAQQTQFFVILDCFCPITPLATQKLKILKKWKKTPSDIIILHMCTRNDNHMMYGSWDMELDWHNFLSF